MQNSKSIYVCIKLDTVFGYYTEAVASLKRGSRLKGTSLYCARKARYFLQARAYIAP